MLGIHRFHYTSALSEKHGTGVNGHLVFKAGTHDGSFRSEQRHSLTHHVGSHQRTVSVVVLQERNQGCSDRGNLVRRDVDQVDILLRKDRIVGQTTGFHLLAQHVVLVHRRVGLGDTLVVFLFGGQEYRRLVEEHLAVLHTTIRSLDKAEVVDLGEHTE